MEVKLQGVSSPVEQLILCTQELVRAEMLSNFRILEVKWLFVVYSQLPLKMEEWKDDTSDNRCEIKPLQCGDVRQRVPVCQWDD